ncbi:hypothetical protein JCM3765_000557 [Sporobolomyces pararoseus]
MLRIRVCLGSFLSKPSLLFPLPPPSVLPFTLHPFPSSSLVHSLPPSPSLPPPLMSIRSIPLEIINEIVSHFEPSFDDDDDLEEAIEAGKSISLVSRAFRPIGQALRWRYPEIDLRSAPSFARHFELHPQLTKLVRFINQRDRDDDRYRRAQRTQTGGEMEDFFEEVIHTASSLQRLETFAFNVFGDCAWSPKLTTALLNGFPRLKEIDFRAFDLVVEEDHQVLATFLKPSKRLSHVELDFPGDAIDISRFVDLFFGALDLSVLRTCGLRSDLMGAPMYQILGQCPRLRELRVYSSLGTEREQFSELVAQLPRLQCIETLYFQGATGTGNGIDSDITIDSVLAAFPPGLLGFSALTVSFNDYESIPVRQRPESSCTEYPTFEALHPSALGYRLLLIWKETEEGRAKWYRSIGRGTTWEEFYAE